MKYILPIIITAIVAASVYFGLQGYASLSGKQKSAAKITYVVPSPSPKPSPTPKPIGQGEQVYNFSHGKNVVGPKLGQVTISEIDPRVGDTQTVTATIKHNTPVTGAILTLVTEKGSYPHQLKRISGGNTDGTWQGSWTIPSSIAFKYELNFTLESATGTYQGGLSLR